MSKTASIIFTLLLLTATNSFATNRTALIIGNSAYKSSPLTNPVNDATDMATTLKSLDFDVILKTNATKKSMVDAIRTFGKKLGASEIGLFYYAGHGMQINGTNYLIPVNNSIREESEVEFEAINAGRILAKMNGAGNPMNIVILDACRDNPFKNSFRSSASGLAKMDAPPGTMIAYATSPGSTAADGSGRNGTYTEALLSNLRNPQLDVQKMFNKTGLDVMQVTSNKQVPWLSTTPFPDYYLASNYSTNSTTVATQPAAILTTDPLIPNNISQNSTLRKILDNGILRVGTAFGYKKYIEGTVSNPRGIEADLVRNIAKRIDVDVKWINVSWNGIIPRLRRNEFDMIAGGMSITDKRKKIVDFVGPYAVIINKGKPDPYGWAVRKGDIAFYKVLNKILRDMKSSGLVDQYVKTWGIKTY